ncbi:hypothetical protein ACFWDG_09725 [Peribacillus sp. NPDC060186]
MTRRSQAVFEPAFRPWLYIAGVGALVLLSALVTLFIQLWVSIRNRKVNRVPVGDPWNAGGLEWSIPAPPPAYNFAVIPTVRDRDPFYGEKQAGNPYPAPKRYESIAMPANSMTGPALGVLGAVTAFGLVWHMWWLAGLGLAASIATVIARSFARDVERLIPAAEVARIDRRWRKEIQRAKPIGRAVEGTPANRGLAEVEA